MSILTCEIYERIKQNARNSSQEDFLSQKIIKTQQKETQLSKARDHLKRMRDYDKRRPILPWSDMEREKEK